MTLAVPPAGSAAPAARRRGPGVGAGRDRLPVSWWTVVLLAALMAYADGFWVTSLRGAVGAVERVQEPFASWLRDGTVALPVFILAVAGSFLVAARRFGPGLRGARAVLVTALLVAAAGSLVAMGQVVVGAVADYRLQSELIATMDANHSRASGPVLDPSTTAVAPAPAAGSAAAVDPVTGTLACDSVCRSRRETLRVHVRGIEYAAAVVVLTNLVLVGWVVAWRGGRFSGSWTAAGTAGATPSARRPARGRAA
ncbi:MAG: hypothetical protein ACKVZ6_00700 [Kineosporiaceae bacterium]